MVSLQTLCIFPFRARRILSTSMMPSSLLPLPMKSMPQGQLLKLVLAPCVVCRLSKQESSHNRANAVPGQGSTAAQGQRVPITSHASRRIRTGALSGAHMACTQLPPADAGGSTGSAAESCRGSGCRQKVGPMSTAAYTAASIAWLASSSSSSS